MLTQQQSLRHVCVWYFVFAFAGLVFCQVRELNQLQEAAEDKLQE